LEDTEEYIAIFKNLFIIFIIVLILLAALVGWLIARRALSDVKSVTLTAEEITNGDYSRRVRLSGQLIEIQQFGRAFNKMLDRIQILLSSMKEINDNIAHDLRSPLARIRGIAEMTLLNKITVDDYRNMAVSTMEECDNLIEMINTMLEITEAEAGVNPARDETFDLVALVTKACELFGPIAHEKRIALRRDLPNNLPFKGDRHKMQRIIMNLIENAIKYTPADGQVKLAAKIEPGLVQIRIEDTGIGIAANDLPHIFERFYKCDRSRSQDGMELGLSLVKALIESMKGSISVRSDVNAGSTFTLRFACCAAL
jgi:signal transduction histidine kinase